MTRIILIADLYEKIEKFLSLIKSEKELKDLIEYLDIKITKLKLKDNDLRRNNYKEYKKLLKKLIG